MSLKETAEQVLALPDTTRIKTFAAVINRESGSVHLSEGTIERAYLKALARAYLASEELAEAAKNMDGSWPALKRQAFALEAYEQAKGEKDVES